MSEKVHSLKSDLGCGTFMEVKYLDFFGMVNLVSIIFLQKPLCTCCVRVTGL